MKIYFGIKINWNSYKFLKKRGWVDPITKKQSLKESRKNRKKNKNKSQNNLSFIDIF